MKKLIMVSLLLIAFATANAQRYQEFDGVSRTSSSSKSASRQPLNEFASTEMKVEDRQLTFTGVPMLLKPTWAVVTNKMGDFITQSKISGTDNTMNVNKLRSGLYFVTLVYKNKSKKAFTLNIGNN